MKHLVLLLSLALLVSCGGRHSGAPRSSAPSPSPAGPREVIRFSVPEGWKLGWEDAVPGTHLAEYVPEGQTVHHWTDMLTIVVLTPDTKRPINAMFQAMTRQWQSGCAVAPIVSAPAISTEGGRPAGLQTAMCGRTKNFGSGEVIIVKMVESSRGFVQVQRAWRFPAVARSQDLPLTQAMRDEAMERLRLLGFCTQQYPGHKC